MQTECHYLNFSIFSAQSGGHDVPSSSTGHLSAQDSAVGFPLRIQRRRTPLPNGRKNLVDRRLEEQPLPGHFLAVNQDRELATVAIHELDIDIRFVLQRCRQTGGMLAGPTSDRALANGYVLHWITPLRKNPLGSLSLCA